MTKAQSTAIAGILEGLHTLDEDMEFVEADLRWATDEDVRIAATMESGRFTADDAEGRDPIELHTAWTAQGDVHNLVSLVASDGELLANYKIESEQDVVDRMMDRYASDAPQNT